MYVKVYGTIRVFKEEKAIVGTHIKKIEKFDEVTNHLLQVFVAHCIRKKGVLSSSALTGQPGQAMGAGANNRMSAVSGANNQRGNGQRFEQFSNECKQIVLEVMRELSKKHKFVHKSDIYNVIQHRMGSEEIFNQALAVLTDDGQIYATYDNDIYSITE